MRFINTLVNSETCEKRRAAIRRDANASGMLLILQSVSSLPATPSSSPPSSSSSSYERDRMENLASSLRKGVCNRRRKVLSDPFTSHSLQLTSQTTNDRLTLKPMRTRTRARTRMGKPTHTPTWREQRRKSSPASHGMTAHSPPPPSTRSNCSLTRRAFRTCPQLWEREKSARSPTTTL